MSGQSIAQVLGASTTIAAITVLPNTGNDYLSLILPLVTLTVIFASVLVRLFKIGYLAI